MRTAKLEEILTEGESTQTSTEGRYRGQGFVVEGKCYKYCHQQKVRYRGQGFVVEGKCYKYCHQQKVDIGGRDLLLRANVTNTVINRR